ncbi:uncharacterized protein LOC127864355 [Dreissena polymorpha]|uniref:Uncharacterized protein n=1 Tax=Dreissena polymorpha TaxID=45954 RepID=A0A9D4NGN2_DREPO|nr:uncharacterized protein LOC127864355 [Dreissena polymorpha]KAH3896178.1 hypothetical protein DPMN_020351 [Dreissena polymorpha]
MLRLRPSDIHYSQDSINNTFDARCKHSGVSIGQTLDDILEGRTNKNNIPIITVVEWNGKWVTADNRRLWVFRELERLGKCTYIDVNEGYFLPAEKLTSTNGGVTVRVRGHTDSYWLNRFSSMNNDNIVLRNSYDANNARSYSSNSSRITYSYPSPPARVQPTQYVYQESISSNSYKRASPEPRENDAWCKQILKILCMMLILVIVWNVFI